ncbi:MAG: hypothetical protein DRP84_12345 [Spirochaetes bacterium]|nr:MAG: hypothetical protein DRP84_12345 [Spirochaetota bacterium]
MLKLKKILKNILIFIIYSNTYLSIGASIVALVSAKLLGLPVNWLILFIPFSASMLIYNLNRYTDVIEDSINVPQRVYFIYKYGKLFIFSGIIMYIISLIYSFIINFTMFIFTLLPVVIAFIYSVLRLKRYLS